MALWSCCVSSLLLFFIRAHIYVCVVVTEKSVLVCALRKIYIVLALLKIGDFSGRVNCALGCQCQPFFPRKRYILRNGRTDENDDDVDKTTQDKTRGNVAYRIESTTIGPYRSRENRSNSATQQQQQQQPKKCLWEEKL